MGFMLQANPAGLSGLQPGRVIGLSGPVGTGLTRLGLALLAEPARAGPIAVLDVRGWFCPLAAWEAGVLPERLIVVRCNDRERWPRVLAALVEGVRAVYAEVPTGVADPVLRRLGALVRARKSSVLLRPLRGVLPAGVAHLRLAVQEVAWEGPDAGHGRLQRRRMVIEASGKGAGGMMQVYEVEDDGTDALRVVPRVAVATAGDVAG